MLIFSVALLLKLSNVVKYFWFQKLLTYLTFQKKYFLTVKYIVCLDIAYFTKKNCNKIIFKYVNNTVDPFLIFFWIKWLWVLWIVHKQCMNSAQCLLYCVIRVHEQYGLLFISLNALFMSHEQCKRRWKKKKAKNAKNANAHLQGHVLSFK